MKIDDMISILQKYKEGEAIAFRRRGDILWNRCTTHPRWWDFTQYEYGVVADEPDSIDWSQVNPKWNFMARDPDGRVFVYQSKPTWGKNSNEWLGGRWPIQVDDIFSSYRRGTVSAEDSLVERPRWN